MHFARHAGTVVTSFSGIVVPLAPNVVKVRIRSYKNYEVRMELVKCHFSLSLEYLNFVSRGTEPGQVGYLDPTVKIMD